jgi:hypothetical protein
MCSNNDSFTAASSELTGADGEGELSGECWACLSNTTSVDRMCMA